MRAKVRVAPPLLVPSLNPLGARWSLWFSASVVEPCPYRMLRLALGLGAVLFCRCLRVVTGSGVGVFFEWCVVP